MCEEGWQTPQTCAGGDCLCSQQSGCPAGCETCELDANNTGMVCLTCEAETPFLLGGMCHAACPATLVAAALPSPPPPPPALVRRATRRAAARVLRPGEQRVPPLRSDRRQRLPSRRPVPTLLPGLPLRRRGARLPPVLLQLQDVQRAGRAPVHELHGQRVLQAAGLVPERSRLPGARQPHAASGRPVPLQLPARPVRGQEWHLQALQPGVPALQRSQRDAMPRPDAQHANAQLRLRGGRLALRRPDELPARLPREQVQGGGQRRRRDARGLRGVRRL